MAFLLLIKFYNFLLKHVTLLGLQLRFSINDPKFGFFCGQKLQPKISMLPYLLNIIPMDSQ